MPYRIVALTRTERSERRLAAIQTQISSSYASSGSGLLHQQGRCAVLEISAHEAARYRQQELQGRLTQLLPRSLRRQPDVSDSDAFRGY